MSTSARRTVFLVGAGGLGALLVAAFVALTAVDDFADLVSTYYLDVAVLERLSYNVVSSVIFDYRGLDTMIEQLILFAAVVGVTLLLRVQRGEEERSPRDSRPDRRVPPTSGALKLAGALLAGGSLVYALYVILHVQITPGGGFQSGVLVAGGLLGIYIADEFDVYDRLTPQRALERVEAGAAGAYVAVGLVALGVSGSFLHNFLPLGALGDLYASGTIWLLDLIVGVEVTAGFVLLFSEFLQQAVLVRERAGR